jgi:hypothetical protein
MAMAGALCLTLHAVTGITNRSLRALVAGLLGSPYSANQMSYDLRRLRLHGLIRRIDGRHRYVLTEEGRTFAVLYTKLGERVVGPIFDTDRPNAPPQARPCPQHHRTLHRRQHPPRRTHHRGMTELVTTARLQGTIVP